MATDPQADGQVRQPWRDRAREGVGYCAFCYRGCRVSGDGRVSSARCALRCRWGKLTPFRHGWPRQLWWLGRIVNNVRSPFPRG